VYITTRLSLPSGQSVNVVSDWTPAAMQKATVFVNSTAKGNENENENENENANADVDKQY
jgi:hypothetical protein